MYVFGGSLVDLAQIGAAATADPSVLKKKKWCTLMGGCVMLVQPPKQLEIYYEA
jgi:hypothetical protein